VDEVIIINLKIHRVNIRKKNMEVAVVMVEEIAKMIIEMIANKGVAVEVLKEERATLNLLNTLRNHQTFP
jgi:hypothetical protein